LIRQNSNIDVVIHDAFGCYQNFHEHPLLCEKRLPSSLFVQSSVIFEDRILTASYLFYKCSEPVITDDSLLKLLFLKPLLFITVNQWQ